MKTRYVAYLFLLPALCGMILFKIYPILLAVGQSLFVESFAAHRSVFVGLTNYAQLFSDPSFINSIAVTLWFNVAVNPLQVVLAVLVGVLVSRGVPGIRTFRSIILIPVGVSVPIASVIWGVLLSPNNGFVNSLLSAVSIPPQPFLVSQHQALSSIMLVVSWIGISYWMLFVVAGLKDIPVQVYEAARIDGATALQSFFHVTIPSLRRTIAFVAVGATTSNLLLFAPSYVLTQGGPAGSTDVLMYEAYTTAFAYSNFHRSGAIVVVVIVIELAIVGLELRLLRSAGE